MKKKASLFLVLALCLPQLTARAQPKPDVLFIAIDDMNDWTTLFNRQHPIQTPNLNRLAARGAFFSKAYCVVPACNPSRTAILTGLSPVTSGVYSNGQSWKQLLPNVVTLPQYFGNHGYTAKGGGKIFHHGGTGTDRVDNPSFDEFFKLQIHANKPAVNYNGYVRGRDPGPLTSPAWDWGVHDVEQQTDEFTVDYVTKVMRTETRDKPLFLAAGIFRPHLPFWAPPESFSRYPFDEVQLPPRPENDLDDVPPIGVKMSRTEAFIFDNTIKPPEDRPGSLKTMVQCYQAAADYADEMVGRLIDELDATGRAENTIIILWSDHGYHLGDKNACVKFTLWEKANHVPFIIVAPGVTKPGTVIDRPVSLLDIYPTLVDLADLPRKDGLDGVSLVPLLKDPKTDWNRPAVMTQGAGNHAVRSDRWRYIRYTDGTEELYDLEKDPWEHTNLASDPEHAEVIAQHKKVLSERHGASRRSVKDGRTQVGRASSLPSSAGPQAGSLRHGARLAPNRIDVTPAEYKPVEKDILIADFEGKDYGDWEVVGEAMGDRPSLADTHKNRVTGYLGKGFINTYLGLDKSTGTLTSPPFAIERKHLNFLIGGGNHPGRAGLQLLIDGKPVRSATGRSLKNPGNEEIVDWQSWDVSEFAGKQARLRIVDETTGGWGHTVVDHIFQSNRPMPSSLPEGFRAARTAAPTTAVGTDPSLLKPGQMDPAHRTFASYGDVGYDQRLRPQFHFSSRKNWINDPNGMVYYDGEWHLYFQHCALSVNRGPKSWGHAVSKDLVHWEQLPHAILPYNKGAIWSGTAVVDHNNSLGKQVGDTKTLVAFFTTTWKEGFYQAMAYSTDRGRTYTLYNNGEPVVPNQGVMKGERDPKVFWDEARQKWKMILILGGKERVIRIFESDNLTDWVKSGDITRKWAAECIDLFQLPVDGDRNNMKWVIADASFDYEVGEFTGNGFETEGPTGRGDYGKGFYAAQTFNNGPDGRVVQIGWMNDRRAECPFLVEGLPFNQQMAFPTDLTLRTTPEGIRLFRWPVPEIESLYRKSHNLSDLTVAAANEALSMLKPELVDLSIEFAPGDDGMVDLTVRGVKITYGNLMKLRASSGEVREVKCFSFNGKSCPAPLIDGKVKLRVLADRASLELYANEGAFVASSYEFDIPQDYTLSISANKEMPVDSLVVNELASIWMPRAEAQSYGKQ